MQAFLFYIRLHGHPLSLVCIYINVRISQIYMAGYKRARPDLSCNFTKGNKAI